MRLTQRSADTAILSTLLLPLLAAGNTIDCSKIVVGDVKFDLQALGGPRSVMESVDSGISSINTTYTVDICRPLIPIKGSKGDKERCKLGTRVCAISRFIKGEEDTIQDVFPIAGELRDHGGKDLDAKWTLLKKSVSHEDSQKEGVLLEMHGGFKMNGAEKKPQEAIIEFLCDRKRTGLENLLDPEDKYADSKVKREDGKESQEGDDSGNDGTPSLEFVRYDTSDPKIDVLRLKWRTMHACEDQTQKDDSEANTGWGFFTWFIVILFLSTATYLIFGSWLNYNRYGARGWDLLPHGDTIRDVPYLFKDWMRRVVNSLQGGGSRGGYAAV